MVGGWEPSRRALSETEEYHEIVKVICKDNGKQKRADINPILEPKKAEKRKITSVNLTLKNTGSGKAENITVSILPSQHFDIVGSDERKIKVINPYDSDTVEFFIKVKFEPSPLDLPLERTVSVSVLFTIVFDDAEKEGKTQQVKDLITFFLSKEAFKTIKNPYAPGIPLKTPEMFYGRDTFLETIETDLKVLNAPVVVLYGQRRIGKTSILYQLKRRLKNDFIPVILDFQGVPDSGTDAFFYWVAYEIWKELSRKNIKIAEPDEGTFLGNSAYFRDFLQKVIQRLGQVRLMLMLDEFEAVHDRIREEKIDRDALSFLQDMMQHKKIDIIFSGTHLREYMESDGLKIPTILYHKINGLKKHEAEALICEPVKEYIQYDFSAVEKILEMTGGHPYFIQLVCYNLINHQKKKGKNYVTVEDVEKALDIVVTTGTAHIEYLWDNMDKTEQIVLLALKNVLSLQKLSTASAIVTHLKKHSFEITEQNVKSILEKFLDEEIIEQTANYYQFKIGLIKLWCEKNTGAHDMEVRQ